MPQMINRAEGLWAGTEASLGEYLDALTAMDAYSAPRPEDDDEDLPRLLEIQGDIGVVKVRGPLTNRDSWLNALFGLTSYNEIREAMISAAQNPEIKQIMLDIDSGGGAVAGVDDTSNLISLVNDKVKPVTAFTDGNMASAAYWLGSSAGKLYASKTAMVGSIGVIATHMERSEALKKEGINVTVMRAGKYKALANGVEPLTEDAKKQMQAHLDTAYRVFVQHVAEARNVSYEMADSQMAQGREFMGEAAVSAGLSDGVMSYDELFNALSKESIDASENLIDNSRKPIQQEWGMPKKALTEKDLAAMSEGVPVAAAAPATVEPEAAAPAAVEPEAAAPAAVEPEAAAPAAVEPEAAAPAADAGLLAFLQAQLKEKDDALVALKVELKGAQDQLESLKAAQSGLVEIAAKSVSNMQVALGGTKLEAEGMSADQILAEHKRVSDVFATKFKVGGVAAVDAAPEKHEQAVDALTRARLNAVRLSK